MTNGWHLIFLEYCRMDGIYIFIYKQNSMANALHVIGILVGDVYYWCSMAGKALAWGCIPKCKTLLLCTGSLILSNAPILGP